MCQLGYTVCLREDEMVMGHVCGQTLKNTVKNLLVPLEIHVKIGSSPLKCKQKNENLHFQ